MSYYGSFVLQCYVLRMRVMTSTVGGNLTKRPPALRHIHVRTSQLMLYREIKAVCSQIHTKHANTLCGQNVEMLNVKLTVHIETNGLQRVKSLL